MIKNMVLGETRVVKAEEHWLDKRVKNPKTGNMVKVKSLPPELRQKYKPSTKQDPKKKEQFLDDAEKKVQKYENELRKKYAKDINKIARQEGVPAKEIEDYEWSHLLSKDENKKLSELTTPLRNESIRKNKKLQQKQKRQNEKVKDSSRAYEDSEKIENLVNENTVKEVDKYISDLKRDPSMAGEWGNTSKEDLREETRENLVNNLPLDYDEMAESLLNEMHPEFKDDAYYEKNHKDAALKTKAIEKAIKNRFADEIYKKWPFGTQ